MAVPFKINRSFVLFCFSFSLKKAVIPIFVFMSPWLEAPDKIQSGHSRSMFVCHSVASRSLFKPVS